MSKQKIKIFRTGLLCLILLVISISNVYSDKEDITNIILIEMVGGPTIDEQCDKYNCPNYTFYDLKTYYWPALIAGVEKYSGENKIQYVGLSHGCRVALDSLKNWSSGKNNAGHCFNSQTGLYDIDCDLSTNVVDTFVGVACVGAFNGSSDFIDAMEDKGDSAISKLENNDENHSTLSRLAFLIDKPFIAGGTFPNREKISLNLIRKYKDWIDDSTDEQPGKGLSINYVSIIYGTCDNFLFPCFSDKNNDIFVPTRDSISIFNNLNTSSNQAYLKKFRVPHHGMPEKDEVKEFIKKNLKKEVIN